MKHSYIFFLIIIFLISCTSGSYTSSTAPGEKRLNDEIYEKEIKTVRIYPLLNDPYEELFPAVAEMGKTTLLLEFDDLVDGTENYYARLIHCNADWTASRLSPLQYLDEFNEFPINDFEFSSGTKLPYVHYQLKIPPVKISGNYILEVYRNSADEVVMRKRIMYYEPLVTITSDALMEGFNPGRISQRINFTLDYSNYELVNPLQRVTVVIRQNQRWDNSLKNLRPTFLRQEIKELEYQYFDEENNFRGGNEFRAFDIRSVYNAGSNVQRVIPGDTTTALLMIDKPRSYQAYAQNRDLNGAFVISNYDRADDHYGSEYVNVIFTLEAGRKFIGDIYINGALTNWKTEEFNRMRYNENLKAYQGKLLLKQGWYNYGYVLKNDTLPSNFIEGSHWQTENNYDILIYYRSINLDADILVGYESWMVNPQF